MFEDATQLADHYRGLLAELRELSAVSLGRTPAGMQGREVDRLCAEARDTSARLVQAVQAARATVGPLPAATAPPLPRLPQALREQVALGSTRQALAELAGLTAAQRAPRRSPSMTLALLVVLNLAAVALFCVRPTLGYALLAATLGGLLVRAIRASGP